MKVMEVYQACRQSGHELLLEVILPAGMPHSDALYLRAIQRFITSACVPTGGNCHRCLPQDGRN